MKRHVLHVMNELLCCLLAILFAYASVSKLLDYDIFKMQLGRSPFISGFAPFIALVLPVIEIIIAALFMLRNMRLLAFYSSLFLLTLFTAYLIAMLRFSYYIPCSCGGVLSVLTWKQHIVFNVAFMLLCIVAIFLSSTDNNTKEIRS